MRELTGDYAGRHDRSTVHRAGGATVVARIGGALLVAYASYVIFAALQAGKPWIAAVLVVILAPLLISVMRAALAGAWSTQQGICVRNIRRTVFVPWDEIDRFAVGSHGMLPKVAILERNSGERIAMWGIQGRNPAAAPNDRAAERVVERLNDDLRAHRAAAAPRGDGPAE